MEWNNWKDSFVEYIRNSDKYWGGKEVRHNRKLISIKKTLCNKFSLKNDEEYLEFILDLAESRANEVKKLYVSNIGGSGSHWLSKMIEEMLGWFDLGEVYLPGNFYQELKNLRDTQLASKFYDSVEMLHGFIYNLQVKDVSSANLINSVHGSSKIPFHRKLYPNCKILYLVRDPRNSTLSVTYRKEQYRNEIHSDKSDKEYLMFNSEQNLKEYFKYRNYKDQVDILVKYEDLKNACVKELGRICKLVEQKRPIKQIKYISEKFSAQNLRKTKKENLKGNLDEGGPSKPWYEKAKTDDLRIMHSILKPSIKGFSYKLGDCFGQEFIYDENIKIDRKTKRFLSKFNDNLSIFINDQWEKPTEDNVTKGDTVKAIRLDAHGLDVKDIVKILKKFEITVLCLSNLETSFVKELLENLNDIEIRYLDASKIKDFPVETLKRFKNLKAVNLSGCEVSKPEKLKAKVYMDY